MHERAITENLLEIALRHAHQAEAKRITGLYLVIGQLSSFIDESVQFYWDILSEDTIAEKAVLHFKRIPVEMLCQDCDCRYSPTDKDFACPDCSGSRVKIIAGEEFLLEAIDVE